MNILSPDSISFTAIKKSLEEYIKSLPDYEQKWKDFYEGGAGQTTTDIAAGLTSFLAFLAYKNRRDSMFGWSKLPTTTVAIAAALGYQYNRRVAPLIKLTFISTESIYWERDLPIGNYKGINLSLLQDTQINVGLNTVMVALGDWASTEFVVNETKDFFSYMVEDNIDNKYYELYINDKQTELVGFPEKSNSTNVIGRSYYTGMFLIFGDGQLGLKPSMGDKVRLEYLQPAEQLDDNTLIANQIQLSIPGTLESGSLSDYGAAPDSVEKVIAVAPGYRNTRRYLISFSDYEWIGSSYEGLVSCQAKPHTSSCCAVDVAYVRDDEALMSPDMITEFEKYLEAHAIMGTSFFIIHPEVINVEISLTVVIDKTADTDKINELIANAYSSQSRKLKQMFSPFAVTADSKLGMQRVVMDYPIVDKQAAFNQYFKVTSLVVKYETDTTKPLQSGTDTTKGYTLNEQED